MPLVPILARALAGLRPGTDCEALQIALGKAATTKPASRIFFTAGPTPSPSGSSLAEAAMIDTARLPAVTLTAVNYEIYGGAPPGRDDQVTPLV